MCSESVMVKLFDAIKANDTLTIRNILTENPEIVCRNDFSVLPDGALSPLWEAMLLGHRTIVRMLLHSGANVNEQFLFNKSSNFYGLTFLHRLAFLNDDWYGSKKIAEILIENGAHVNAYFHPTRKTPLEVAIEQGNCSYVEFLLNNGAKIMKKKISFAKSVEFRFKYVYIAFIPMLHVLRAPKIKQKEILKILMKYGFETRFRYEQIGFDHLHFNLFVASQWPNKIDIVEIVKIFLNCGLPVNGLDKDGISPLIRAVNLQNIELVSLLINSGAEVNFKSKFHGISALRTAAFLNNTTLIDLLLSNGAEINIQCDYGWTVLHLVCYRRSEKSIKFLIQKGINIFVEDNRGNTPFFYLNPLEYKESDVSCIQIMVREFSKLKFSNDLAVPKKDMDLVECHVQEYFQNCMEKLSEMSSFKFYAGYSYYFVLKMSKNNLKKLANLTKNEEFVTNFEQNVHKFSHYENELRKILEAAIQFRDRSIVVDSRLTAILGDRFPDIVLRKLGDILKVKDLPLQPTDSWKCDRRFYLF